MFNPKGQETLIKHHQTNKEIEHPTVKKNDEKNHIFKIIKQNSNIVLYHIRPYNEHGRILKWRYPLVI